ncbi:MAG: serine/threonine protein kinase [Clostridiales bacterium]|nr:serine/threonine protein kinase [Clostridiales bacterium]
MDQERDQDLIFSVDGISYTARKQPELSWLQPYGKVFYVFDQQTSGNLCFGVDGPYGKLFIKYAGARTARYTGRPEVAVETLKKAMPLYQHAHPALTRLRGHGPTAEGYAAIFAWEDMAALRPFPPDGRVLQQVQGLPWQKSLKMLDGVFDLHAQLAEAGYIAVDFWDGNVLIDFSRCRAVVCDIDLYRKKPAVNDRGRMPGSSRFLSPEEYTLGAPLDESTTVFAMGALAFEFYGENHYRSRRDWVGPPALYDVARRATQEKREKRYPSLRAFLQEWRGTVGLTPLGDEGIY